MVDSLTEFEVPYEETAGPVVETGTTIVAVAAGETVVVAADQRASLGGRFVSNKDVTKVEQVHPSGVIALSGSVGGLQSFADTLRAEASLYSARRGEPLSLDALAKVGGNLIRGVPGQVILGGVDEDGPAVFELDGGGAVMRTDYAAGGSGMQVAYGVLEGRAEAIETVADARELAGDTVAAASERDTASGNGITVAEITAEGVELDSFAEPTEVV
ncbi:proteasome subunit beta [Haloarchaeobius sp. DFWS5]|uniref:proteasome subunit beta n=1 Tax=Haloarchaeobius sp. DFWS5 TaxID=3446114 RepID=UPI003EBCEA05